MIMEEEKQKGCLDSLMGFVELIAIGALVVVLIVIAVKFGFIVWNKLPF